jgi:hypothetical protein
MHKPLEAPPDIAWQCNIGAVLVRMSWEAMGELGIHPTTHDNYDANPPGQNPGIGYIHDKFPGLNVDIMSAAEYWDVRAALAGAESGNSDSSNLTIARDRLFINSTLPVGRNCPVGLQIDYFKKQYRDYASAELLNLLGKEPSAYQRLARPLLLASIKSMAARGIRIHSSQYPSTTDKLERAKRNEFYLESLVAPALYALFNEPLPNTSRQVYNSSYDTTASFRK